jgi:succinate dehydrogenase/fumarate reductase-like Fe-S protein
VSHEVTVAATDGKARATCSCGQVWVHPYKGAVVMMALHRVTEISRAHQRQTRVA